MTYPISKPKRPKAVKILAWVFGILATLMCLGGVINIAAAGPSAPEPGVTLGSAAAQAAGAAGTPIAEDALEQAAPQTLRPVDVDLTVKTKSKDCFGSYGCNVVFEIKAVWPAISGGCDVTYEVKGFDEPKVGTLELRSDATVKQDSYQYGKTNKSTQKLTAKATEVDCS
jgi:hypothetical protein